MVADSSATPPTCALCNKCDLKCKEKGKTPGWLDQSGVCKCRGYDPVEELADAVAVGVKAVALAVGVSLGWGLFALDLVGL